MIAEAASSCMYSIQLFTDIFKIVFFLFFCIYSTYTLVVNCSLESESKQPAEQLTRVVSYKYDIITKRRHGPGIVPAWGVFLKLQIEIMLRRAGGNIVNS